LETLPFLSRRLQSKDFVPELRRGDFSGWDVALFLRLHLRRPLNENVQYLRFAAADGSLLRMWHNPTFATAMKLTERCIGILTLLASARWLKTSQVHRRYFADASFSAARRRLRLLEEEKFVFRYRENHMTESLWTVGREGRRILEKRNGRSVCLERRPPKQLEHYVGINDIRIAAETAPEMEYFFAAWELPALNWRHRLIPDGIIGFPGRTFALEFDRGHESLQYFARTKIDVYRRGLPGFPIRAVLIVAEAETRMRSLMKLAPASPVMLFSTLDRIRRHGLAAPIFYGVVQEQIYVVEPVPSNCSHDATGLDS